MNTKLTQEQLCEIFEVTRPTLYNRGWTNFTPEDVRIIAQRKRDEADQIIERLNSLNEKPVLEA